MPHLDGGIAAWAAARLKSSGGGTGNCVWMGSKEGGREGHSTGACARGAFQLGQGREQKAPLASTALQGNHATHLAHAGM